MGLSIRTLALVALASSAGIGASASAGLADNFINLTFSDPSGATREISYTQPAQSPQLGVVSYNTEVPIDLEIQLNDFGIDMPLVITTNLSMNVSVGPSTFIPETNQNVAATFNGMFEFRRESDDAVLITGRFLEGSLARRGGSGGLEANGEIEPGGFELTFSDAFLTELSNFGFAFPGFDSTREATVAWTLTRISQIGSGAPVVQPPGYAENFLRSFTADSAFTAAIPVIPTPGAMSLALAAGLLCFGVRRR